MYFTRAGELAEQADDAEMLGYALLNLGNSQLMREPAAAAATLRRSRLVARRIGDRGLLAVACATLSLALLDLGEWDEAAEVMSSSTEPALADEPLVPLLGVFLSALRGDVDAAREGARVELFSDSEDPQERAFAMAVATYVAVAEGRPSDVLAHGRATLELRRQIGIGSDAMRLTWPMAARAALDLDDAEATGELLAMLDAELPGRLPPLLRAERELVRARVAAVRGDDDAGRQLEAAIATMRRSSPPHLLASGLLDHAAYLLGQGDDAAAAVSVAEARQIAERLGARPIVDRADGLLPLRTAEPA